MSRVQGFLAQLRGIVQLGHHTLDKGNGDAVIFKDALLGLGVPLAECRAPSLPTLHEVIGRHHS